MEKSLFISNFKKLPFAFLASILLFFMSHLIMEAVLAKTDAFWRFCILYTTHDAVRFDAQLKTMSENDEHKKVFLIGSSQVREGFDVEYLNNEFKKTGTIFYNFGLSGAGHPVEALMLKGKLLAEDPVVIIYTMGVPSFYSDYEFSRMKYYFDPTALPFIQEYLKKENITIPRDVLITAFLGEASILFKYRRVFPGTFYTALKNYLHIEERSEPVMYEYKTNKPKSYFVQEVKKAKKNKYKNTPTTELEFYSFSLFARDIVSNNVKLIVIDGPTHPLFQECYKKELFLVYNDFISEQAEKIHFDYLPKSRLPMFTEDDFIDFSHLNSSGRSKLSRFLKDYLLEEKHW